MENTNCGCTEISPDISNMPINIAPAPELAPQQAALLTPRPLVPQVDPININVWVKDIDQPQQIPSEDMVSFTINFVVSIYDEASNSTKSITVPKKIQASKRKLLADGELLDSQVATVVENVKQPYKKSDAQRMRELAGIPHSKNHV